MKTIILDAPGNLRVADSEEPQRPGAGQALVRVHRVGICGTDMHAFRGRQPFFQYPRILGHELGVEVLEIGENEQANGRRGERENGRHEHLNPRTPEHPLSPLRVGSRCSVEPYLNCGHCIACRRGKPNCCAELRVLGVHTDGGMREQIVVPLAKLHPSDILSYEQLALVETLGIGAHAVARARIEAEEWALVIGAGPIGLATMQFASEAGAKVIVLDVNPARLAFAQAQMGIAATVPAGADALDRVRELTDGDLPTAVFDATGSAVSMTEAFRYVAPGGRLVFVGLVLADITFHDPDFHRREITLLATRNSTPADFRRIIGLMETGRIDTAPWITHRAACDEIVGCFPTWLEPATGTIKAVVSF